MAFILDVTSTGFFTVKVCAQVLLTVKRTKPAQEKCE